MDMGPLTLVRGLLQRDFKFEPPVGSGSKLKAFYLIDVKNGLENGLL